MPRRAIIRTQVNKGGVQKGLTAHMTEESTGKGNQNDDEGSEFSPPLSKGSACFRLHLSPETSLICGGSAMDTSE